MHARVIPHTVVEGSGSRLIENQLWKIRKAKTTQVLNIYTISSSV